MSRKISTSEPADRPYNIALSEAEIIALADWHLKVAKSIPKKLGQTALNLSANTLFRPGRDSKALFSHARQQIDAHCLRARGLSSILK
jgi:hypothetical protein